MEISQRRNIIVKEMPNCRNRYQIELAENVPRCPLLQISGHKYGPNLILVQGRPH
ncbi:hypothetical protein ES288_D07G082300v1 [Gossypium darwinii]|uniref:Uncharacterized protein n=1 Tax=Gossypium darwinii TaxID=34276 RepID=A0A5D2BWY1_GOSDA|nr:hypothetical protein ES288_D07G082300v1 [Gossypium darwinii]